FRSERRRLAASQQSRVYRIRHAGATNVAAVPGWRLELLHRHADLKEKIKVAFASGSDELNGGLVERMAALFPELPLYVVSEFPPQTGRWVPYHVSRSFFENLARCRAAWRGKHVRLAGVLLAPQMPYRRMRLIALVVSPIGFLAF